MFLSKKLKLTNNVRHRRELKWEPFLKNKLKENYKKRHFTNFVEYKLPAYAIKDFYSNNFNKKIYSIISDFSDNHVLSPNKYGLEIGHTAKTHHYGLIFLRELKLFEYMDINRTFLSYCPSGTVVYYIKNILNGVTLAVANGVFAIIYKHDRDLNLTKVKLPSGQFKYIDSKSDAYKGRNGNLYFKYVVWGSWGYKFFNKHHRPIVRGVAMNPIDHPNGGRSKVKKPFRNKYNKIAKKGK